VFMFFFFFFVFCVFFLCFFCGFFFFFFFFFLPSPARLLWKSGGRRCRERGPSQAAPAGIGGLSAKRALSKRTTTGTPRGAISGSTLAVPIWKSGPSGCRYRSLQKRRCNSVVSMGRRGWPGATCSIAACIRSRSAACLVLAASFDGKSGKLLPTCPRPTPRRAGLLFNEIAEGRLYFQPCFFDPSAWCASCLGWVTPPRYNPGPGSK